MAQQGGLTQEVSQKGAEGQRPGFQHEMRNQPICLPPGKSYQARGLLQDRVALITGGDSGIGRAVACLYAAEGAKVAICFHPSEEKDAREAKQQIKETFHDKEKCSCGSDCQCEDCKCTPSVLLCPADVTDERQCQSVVQKTVEKYGKIDILVNNAAEQHVKKNIMDISAEQLESTFRTNVFSMFHLVKAALPHMHTHERPADQPAIEERGPGAERKVCCDGSTIINSTSLAAYMGIDDLIDYSATKGAIVSFTRSLAKQLAPKGIRVNAVAPGPVNTPLQPISRGKENLQEFVQGKTPLGQIAEPGEIAPSYVFLASYWASQYTGQVLHPNGGFVVNT